MKTQGLKNATVNTHCCMYILVFYGSDFIGLGSKLAIALVYFFYPATYVVMLNFCK